MVRIQCQSRSFSDDLYVIVGSRGEKAKLSPLDGAFWVAQEYITLIEPWDRLKYEDGATFSAVELAKSLSSARAISRAAK